MSLEQQAQQELADRFGQSEAGSKVCIGTGHGRVNLIGDHTDYNDGFVLPMLLPYKTVVAVRHSSNRDDLLPSRFVSKAMPDSGIVDVDLNTTGKESVAWVNYVKGAFKCFQDAFIANAEHRWPSLDVVVVSNVPIGAGVSSSAALEVAALRCLLKFHSDNDAVMKKVAETTNFDLAKLCQRIEHVWAGVPCGLMDQAVNILVDPASASSSALLLDCKDLSFSAVPIPIARLAFIVVDSGVKHELASSAYVERVAQCKQALELLGVKSCRDINLELLRKVENSQGMSEKDHLVLKRVRHVVLENDLVTEFVSNLKSDPCDLTKLGDLFTKSHATLRDNYEVSCEEIDALIARMLTDKRIFGARMTGGGFGGCVVAITARESAQAVEASLKEQLPNNFIAIV